jgi:hypothetical protein
MGIKLVQANAVIVARSFNPPIISQYWLIKTGIMAEGDFEDGCVFSPVVADVRGKEFHLLVLPEQIQFAPKPKVDNSQELIVAKLGGIISELPHTPFIAAGLNYVWQVNDDNISTLCRGLFYRNESPVYRAFDADDARFGAYMSKNTLGSRLKLDIKPVNVSRSDGESVESLQFAFNFHRDLKEESKVDSIKDLLSKWDSAKDMSLNIVNKAMGKD